MKIAVLSDVHGNVPALEAVLEDLNRWQPDEVIVNGDLVSRGPYSLRCLELLQEQLPHCRCLKGNHETWVVGCADTPEPHERSLAELERVARWTHAQLGDAVERLRAWEDHVDMRDSRDNASLHVTHGSRLGNRDGIHPGTDPEKLPEKLGDPRDLFVCSHTHKPMVRPFNGTLVVNTGSVGQPFDGDARSAYGRFSYREGGWEAEIARVAYDRERAQRDFIDSGFVDECGALAHMIFLEFRECRPHVARWRRRYMEAIQSGEIDLVDSVDEYFQQL